MHFKFQIFYLQTYNSKSRLVMIINQSIKCINYIHSILLHLTYLHITKYCFITTFSYCNCFSIPIKNIITTKKWFNPYHNSFHHCHHCNLRFHYKQDASSNTDHLHTEKLKLLTYEFLNTIIFVIDTCALIDISLRTRI